MENSKNKKFKINIDTGLDKQTNEILSRYWKFNGLEFNERVGEIGKDYNIYYTQLLPIVKKYSKACLYDSCNICDNPLKFEVRSQTKFLEYYCNPNLCPSCKKVKEGKQAQRNKEMTQEKDNRRSILMKKAIEEYAWQQLNFEENKVLFGILEHPNKNVDYKSLRHQTKSEKHHLINKFKSLGLIDMVWAEDRKERIFIFDPALPKKLYDHLKIFENPEIEHFTKSWSRLSFEMKKNPFQKKTGNSMFRGTITFKEDFVIKAGTKCAYATYSRDNGSGWFSLTPVADVVLSENRTFEEEPMHISTLLDRMFENRT